LSYDLMIQKKGWMRVVLRRYLIMTKSGIDHA